MKDYPVLPGIGAVPEDVWAQEGLIVEKFVPERDGQHFFMRVWIFLGDQERSFRLRAAVPVIKARHILEREAVEVPQEIRQWRQRLGFDYGKFDYFVCDGKPILIDANRTPGTPTGYSTDPQVRAGMALLSRGLDAFIDPP
jgi:hypothetical protein